MKRTHASRFARFTALLLTLCLLAGMMPAAVFAENTDPIIMRMRIKVNRMASGISQASILPISLTIP